MSLRKFEDFEHSLEEEDKNEHANDFANASKDLIANAKNITSISAGKNPGEVIIEYTINHGSWEEDFTILTKVIGYIE